VPQVTLPRGQVEPLQFGSKPGTGPFEVGRVVNEVIDDAPGVSARQFRLRRGPVAPAGVQDRLLAFRLGPVVFIRRRERESQGAFEVAQDHLTGDERGPVSDAAESLVVEVIWDSHLRDLGKRCLRAFNVRGGETSESYLEAIGANVFGRVRNRNSAEEGDLKGPVSQIAVRAIVDGEVLD